MKSLKQNGIAVTVFMALSTIGTALAPATAQAQTATFMKVDGIPGSSTDPRHLNWINVASLGQSASNPATPSPNVPSAGRVSGACELEILKGLDAAGPHLWLALFTGKPITQVDIEVWMTRPTGDQVKVYEVRLKGVRITSINAASAVTFAETVHMTGDSIELDVTPYSPTGAAMGQIRTGYDCRANVAN
jgi:type VI secretion system secreted protein Hcp